MMTDPETESRIKKKAEEFVRSTMYTSTVMDLYRLFGLDYNTSWFADQDVDGLDLAPELIESLKKSGYGTIEAVLRDSTSHLRKKGGMEGHLKEFLGALAKYVYEDWAMTFLYAGTRRLPLYRILGYEDISMYRNVPVDVFCDYIYRKELTEVPKAAWFSGIVTMYGFLKLDLMTIEAMMLSYRAYEIREVRGCQNMMLEVDRKLLFRYLVELDSRLKRHEILPDCRYLTPWDAEEGPRPATYPINPAWKRKIRRLLDAYVAGKEVFPDGLPDSFRAVYNDAVRAIDGLGVDVYREVQYRRDYTEKLGDAFGYYAASAFPETEQYAWLHKYLYGIPESIRNMKMSGLVKYYDMYRDSDLYYLDENAMDMTAYAFFSAYVEARLAKDPRLNEKTAERINHFLMWTGSSSMEQVIEETFTRKMGESLGLLPEELERIRQWLPDRAAGMSRKEAGAKLGVTNMQIAADEKSIDWCLFYHINGEGNCCIHELAAVYFLMNPGEKSLDRKTLDGLLGPRRAFVYWNYIQRNYEELKNHLYRYSPDDDTIYLRYARKKKAAAPQNADKPKRGRPKGSRNTK